MIAGASALMAQNAQGQGYGGPPKSDEERALRQAACIEKNGGVCPSGGPRQECQGQGGGKGKGKGACDGTGPKGQGKGKGFSGGKR
jgi:hypothetical protein